MSTYQELKGLKVKYLSSDTSGDRVKEGEVFYNSTDFKLKSFVSTAAWHSSANIINPTTGIANTGTTTASIAYGGNVPPTTTAALEYNGSGWSTAPSLPEARSEMSKAGTQTAVFQQW